MMVTDSPTHFFSKRLIITLIWCGSTIYANSSIDINGCC